MPTRCCSLTRRSPTVTRGSAPPSPCPLMQLGPLLLWERKALPSAACPVDSPRSRSGPAGMQFPSRHLLGSRAPRHSDCVKQIQLFNVMWLWTRMGWHTSEHDGRGSNAVHVDCRKKSVEHKNLQATCRSREDVNCAFFIRQLPGIASVAWQSQSGGHERLCCAPPTSLYHKNRSHRPLWHPRDQGSQNFF